MLFSRVSRRTAQSVSARRLQRHVSTASRADGLNAIIQHADYSKGASSSGNSGRRLHPG